MSNSESEETNPRVVNVDVPAVQNVNLLVGDIHGHHGDIGHHYGDIYYVRNRLEQEVAHSSTASPSGGGRIHADRYENHDAILRKLLNQYADIMIGSQDIDPVPLIVMRETQRTLEDFGTGSFFIKEKSSALIPVNELFNEAKKVACQEAKLKCRNVAAITSYAERNGNNVIVIGIAGIGKSTLAKQYLKHIRYTIALNKNSYLFIFDLKKLDNDKELGILEFLTKPSNAHWKHRQDIDNQILNKLSKSPNVFIIMDGLDEANFKNLPTEASVVGLYDRAKPEVIFQNLLRGDILVNAHKLLLSRPGAYHDLHPSCKVSLVPFKVTGIDESSQDLLFQRICSNKTDYEKVQNALSQNPSAKALCFTPLFAKIISRYIVTYGTKDGVFTVADVFAYIVAACVRSPKFQKHPNIMQNLSQLALNGMLQGRTTFDLRDFAQVGLEAEGLGDFIKMQVFSDDICLKIMDGDKMYFFIHLLWQEFFSALQLMFVTDIKRFSELLGNMKKYQWEMVVRFLFGLLNSNVHRKLQGIFTISSADIASKRNLLKEFVVSLGSNLKIGKHSTLTTKFFKLCGFTHESCDDDITEAVGNSLPPELKLFGTWLLELFLLPNQVAGLCYVLRATVQQLVISIDATYSGNGLELLMEAMAQTHHKMGEVRVDTNKPRDLAALIACAEKIDKLMLICSNIAKSDLEVLSDGIASLAKPMHLLDLSYNELKSEELALLGKCVHKLYWLGLSVCSISGSDLSPVTNAICNLDRPLGVFILCWNKLGSQGLSLLAECVHKINKLDLSNCEIVGPDLQPLAEAISRLNQPLMQLNLSDNKLGLEGLALLKRCAHKVDNLFLYECDIDEADIESLHKLRRDYVRRQASGTENG